jgi:hypothetical protein
MEISLYEMAFFWGGWGAFCLLDDLGAVSIFLFLDWGIFLLGMIP